MTHQPQDGVSHRTYNEIVFDNLYTKISFPGSSQFTNSQPDADLNKHLPWPCDESLATDVDNGFTAEMCCSSTAPLLAPSYSPDEQLFPDCQLDELEPSFILDDPVNEETVITTPSDTEYDDNNIIKGTLSELNSNKYDNMTLEQIETDLKHECDQISLEHIDNCIKKRTMYVEVQPPNNHRNRYKTDGKRQITKSRTKPMVVKLPGLKDIKSDPHPLFLLRLGLITHSANPSDSTFIHANKFEYHSDDVVKFTDGTVGVPITPDEIEDEEKTLHRLSTIKTKLNAYKSRLIPFSVEGIGNNLDGSEEEKTTVKEAKITFKRLNMKASRIFAQLLIQQNDSTRFTDIICETHVIEDKGQAPTTKKRPVEFSDSDDDEQPSTSKSKPIKRQKRSN